MVGFGDLVGVDIAPVSKKTAVKFKISETASWSDSGQLQFWSESSEILNIRSSNNPETVLVSISLYLEV